MKTKHTRMGRTLTVAAVVASVVSAFAQEAPKVAPVPPPAAAPGAPDAPTTAPASSIAWADREFLQKAIALHMTGAELAKLAENNAGTEEIQALGDELLAEHTRSLAALREIARMKNMEFNSELSASQQATISEFAAKLGHKFDVDYRAQALSNHEQAIRAFSEAAKGAKDYEIRSYAERSLGEMKERHAALGGGDVKIKGSFAASLPKPAKSLPPETPAKKVAKPIATPPEPATPAPAAVTAVAQEQPVQAQRLRPAPRPMPVSTFVQNFDGTYSIVDPTDPRVTNPASAGGQTYAQPVVSVPAAQPPTTSDPRALWRVPREFADEDRRLARQPSMNVIFAGEASTAPKRTSLESADDAAIASAPVARVVASNDALRQVITRGSHEPAYSDPVIIVRRAPATRTFRIFGNDD